MGPVCVPVLTVTHAHWDADVSFVAAPGISWPSRRAGVSVQWPGHPPPRPFCQNNTNKSGGQRGFRCVSLLPFPTPSFRDLAASLEAHSEHMHGAGVRGDTAHTYPPGPHVCCRVAGGLAELECKWCSSDSGTRKGISADAIWDLLIA